MIIHETSRLLLQSWELKDFEPFAEIARNPMVMRYIAEGEPWSDARIGWFMGRQSALLETLGYCNWKLVDRKTLELVGFCGLAPLKSVNATEIGWWLKPDFWGQGYATEAAQKVLEAAWSIYGFSSLVARAYSTNERSLRLIGRLGFKKARTIDTNHIGAIELFSIEP